jgi:hypothetical protein
VPPLIQMMIFVPEKFSFLFFGQNHIWSTYYTCFYEGGGKTFHFGGNSSTLGATLEDFTLKNVRFSTKKEQIK